MTQAFFERKSTTAPPSNPAGEYVADLNPTSERRAELIAEIELLPSRLRQLVAGLTTFN